MGWRATYNRASITSTTTRTRGANGAWETVESVFARRTGRARGTLQRGRWLEEACWKAQDHQPNSAEKQTTLPTWLGLHGLILVHSHSQARLSRILLPFSQPLPPESFYREVGTPVFQAEGPEVSLGLGPSKGR